MAGIVLISIAVGVFYKIRRNRQQAKVLPRIQTLNTSSNPTVDIQIPIDPINSS